MPLTVDLIKNINQLITSINNWRCSYNNHKPIKKYKIKNVYKIDFGLAYQPEMAFEHRGIVLGKKDNLYYVVPITTLNTGIHSDAYHPKDNLNGNQKYYLLKELEYEFLDHTSVVKCNDIKTVSYLRFKKFLGTIRDDIFEEILSVTFRNIFPTIDYNQKKLQRTKKKNYLQC